MGKDMLNLVSMAFRDDILAAPRGTIARLVRETGLSKQTILPAVHGRNCSPSTAFAIATAMGAPDRWGELVVFRKKPTANHPSLSQAS